MAFASRVHVVVPLQCNVRVDRSTLSNVSNVMLLGCLDIDDVEVPVAGCVVDYRAVEAHSRASRRQSDSDSDF